MRKIDGKFHIEGDKIIKTPSGEEVPEDEPLILFRARDYLALPALRRYKELCIEDGCTDYQLKGIDDVIQQFEEYAQNNPTKQPGWTRGKAWTVEDVGTVGE